MKRTLSFLIICCDIANHTMYALIGFRKITRAFCVLKARTNGLAC